MNRSLFVYGTLTNSEILLALTGRTYATIPAKLDGHAVYQLHKKMCPGMIVEKQSTAEGFVLLNIDDESYGIIEAWEDSGYSCKGVVVTTASGNKMSCETFIWNHAVIKKSWSNKVFRKKGLHQYIKLDIPNFINSLKKK